MKREDVAALVGEAVEAWVEGMDRHHRRPPDRLEDLMRVMERSVPQVRGYMEAAADGPDDPTAAQIEQVRFGMAAIVKVAAAGMALLETMPLEREHMGLMEILAGPKH